MKANEAPKKIYLTQTENGKHYYTEGVPSERNHIEYTRSDVFIEKAVTWMKLYVLNHDIIDIFEMEKDFKTYMEGE